MHVNPVDESGGERRFLFSRRIRRVLFYAGLFVLYSQLVGTGLTGVYRYTPWELSFVDGGNPEVFEPCTLTLLQPPEGIGTINDLQAIGWKIEFPPIRYALWTIVSPILGSGALLLASIARKTWLVRCLLLLGSCVGAAAAIVIKLYEWGAGSIGWAFSHGIMTDTTLDSPPHPVYGYVELIGSFFLPLVVYTAIAAFIIASGLGQLARWSISASRRRFSHSAQIVGRNHQGK